MEIDPARALQLALSPAVRAKLPADVTPYLEREVEQTGRLEVIIEEGWRFSTTRYVFVGADGRRYRAHFATQPNVPRSGRVKLKGVALEARLAADASNVTPLDTTGQRSMAALGDQNALIILVNFQDRPEQPFTPADVQKVFSQVVAYYEEASYGQTRFSGTVAGWYTLPLPTGNDCLSDQVFEEAVKAADPVVYFPKYNHIILIFPSGVECGYYGYGSIGGGSSFSTADGTVTAGRVRIGGMVGPSLFVHELGHSLGLAHANRMSCGTETLNSFGCVEGEYAGAFDPMAAATLFIPHFNAVHKDQLGYFEPANIATIESPGTATYILAPLEQRSTQLQVLKILKDIDATGYKRWYYVENRNSIGFDQPWIESQPDNFAGALVHLGYESYSGSFVLESLLLDMTPRSQVNDHIDAALAIGRTYTDAEAMLAITPIENRADGTLVVQVTRLANSQLSIAVENPIPGGSVIPQNDRVSIIGTAAGSELQEYNLAYGIGADLQQWTPLVEHSANKVSHGLLGTLPTADLPLPLLGTLKLETRTDGGFVFKRLSLFHLRAASSPPTPKPTPKPTPAGRQLATRVFYPRISGDRIVWVDGNSRPVADIHLYDLTTNTERPITATSAVFESSPDIAGDQIVWWNYYIDTQFGLMSQSPTLSQYDLTRKITRQITPKQGDYSALAISANQIIWAERDRATRSQSVHLYDLTTNTERQMMIASQARHLALATSGRWIVWGERDPSTVDRFGTNVIPALYLYDLTTNSGRKIITAKVAIKDFAIDGDQVVFTDELTRYGANIYLYDLITNTQRLLTTSGRAMEPAISGNRIVWRDSRNGPYDVYLYDLTTDAERRITLDQYCSAVDISDDHIVWTDKNSNLYLVDLSGIPSSNGLGSISGQVRTRDGLTPLSGIRLDLAPRDPPNLRSCGPNPLRSITTDADGRFSFEQLWQGRYVVCPDDPLWKFLPRTKSVLLSRRDKTNVKFLAMPVAIRQSGAQIQPSPTQGAVKPAVPQNPVSVVFFSVAPSHFSPNAKGESWTFNIGGVNAVTLQGSLNHPATWQLQLTNSAGKVIRTFTGATGAGVSFLQKWDGKTNAGAIAPAGSYTCRLLVTDASGSQDTRSGTVIVDPPSPSPAPRTRTTPAPPQKPSKRR